MLVQQASDTYNNGKMKSTDDFEIVFVRKQVKHYSIHIAGNGDVHVTVPMRGTYREAEHFVREKQDWILKKRMEQQRRIELCPEELVFRPEDREELLRLLNGIYPLFETFSIPFPTVKFRLMRGRWGSCTKAKREITLNKMCKLLPRDCQEYVIAHELSHLKEANHGKRFYEVLRSVLPDYRQREKKLDHFRIQRKT